MSVLSKIKFFKKKEIDPIDLEIKKYPKKEHKRLRMLYDDYQKGKILQPGKNIDNKEYIISRG